MSDAPPQPGLYRHYKGGLYRVVDVALDCTNGPTEGRYLVLYCLADEPEPSLRELHAREVEQFLETVDLKGERVPRFVKVAL